MTNFSSQISNTHTSKHNTLPPKINVKIQSQARTFNSLSITISFILTKLNFASEESFEDVTDHFK